MGIIEIVNFPLIFHFKGGENNRDIDKNKGIVGVKFFTPGYRLNFPPEKRG